MPFYRTDVHGELCLWRNRAPRSSTHHLQQLKTAYFLACLLAP